MCPNKQNFSQLLISCGYANYKAIGAFVIIFSSVAIFSTASEAFAPCPERKTLQSYLRKRNPKYVLISNHFSLP